MNPLYKNRFVNKKQIEKQKFKLQILYNYTVSVLVFTDKIK